MEVMGSNVKGSEVKGGEVKWVVSDQIGILLGYDTSASEWRTQIREQDSSYAPFKAALKILNKQRSEYKKVIEILRLATQKDTGLALIQNDTSDFQDVFIPVVDDKGNE